jgi:hypothetical protein
MLPGLLQTLGGFAVLVEAYGQAAAVMPGPALPLPLVIIPAGRLIVGPLDLLLGDSRLIASSLPHTLAGGPSLGGSQQSQRQQHD